MKLDCIHDDSFDTYASKYLGQPNMYSLIFQPDQTLDKIIFQQDQSYGQNQFFIHFPKPDGGKTGLQSVTVKSLVMYNFDQEYKNHSPTFMSKSVEVFTAPTFIISDSIPEP